MSESDSLVPRDVRRLTRLLGVGLAGLVAVAVGVSIDWGPAILVLAGASLIGTLSVVWRSIESLTEDSTLDLEEALSLAVPNEEEERKRSILRALRDLEFEHSVGKVTEEDYERLSQRYRAEARRLLRRIDEDLGPARKRAEHDLQVELHKAGLGEKPTGIESTPEMAAAQESWGKGESAWDTQSTTAPARDAATTAPAPRPTRGCEFCEDRNSLLADVCDSCGKPLAAEGERLCHGCPARYPADQSTCPVCGVKEATT